MLRVALFASAGMLAPAIASADQCQIVDADAGAWALKVIQQGKAVVSFCEPCGDKKPAGPETVTTADYKAGQVTVNAKEIDLAYTYVQTGAKTWTNVALLVGCPAHGVSATIDLGGMPKAKPTYPKPTRSQ